jgi:DNA-binding NtrC family response regulator
MTLKRSPEDRVVVHEENRAAGLYTPHVAKSNRYKSSVEGWSPQARFRNLRSPETMSVASTLAASRALGCAPRVLVADDEPPVVRVLRRLLEGDGYQVLEAYSREEALDQLDQGPEVVLLDLRLGEASGQELLGRIRSRSPDTEVVIVTGYATVDSAVECMRAGAFDYLSKPFDDPHRVLQTLRRALEHRALRVRNRELEGELGRRSVLEGIVGQGPAMRRVVQVVLDLSASESNVLIQAESGTGKELIARAIHETSPRSAGPFVPVDCGALPEGIVESELFGHERGAFTGADRPSAGLFRAATRGTLFLDEVGELPLAAQVKLLRAIQEREIRPVGSTRPVPVDARIVAATNRNLEDEVGGKRFRADLYYRLRVISLELPPLRERPEDIPLLAAHFVERYGRGKEITGLEPAALEALLGYPWPGNIRELENRIEAAMALARGPNLTLADLALDTSRVESGLQSRPRGTPLSLRAYERACLEEALERADGSVRRAAELLGLGRSTLYRKLHQHGLT